MSQTITYNDIGVYKLQLPSVPESITLVDNFVDSLMSFYEIPQDIYANIITSLNEAVTNAIHHGNKQNPNKNIKLSAEIIENTKLICIVEDEGAGFNFNILPDPTAPENLENLTGRGVYIMKKLADQCIYNATGNEVELHFRL
ncbi:MAG: ATP-binding protein [Sphingobacteriales bacterium]|nr:MAG: ATP-binding protein [Sphingobacteriales bacterium]